jgi:hypothetical protein
MNTHQLSLFPEAQRELETAIHKFNRLGVPHKYFRTLIQSLASAIKSSMSGTTFVLGCPTDRGFEEIISATMKEVRKSFPANGDESPGFTSLQVRSPSGVSAKQVRMELLDRYRTELHCASIRYHHRPQFLSSEAWSVTPRTDLGQLVGLLRHKRPSLVIVRDIHNLARPGAPKAEAAAALGVLTDIAAQSSVNHLLTGSVTSVLDLMEVQPSLMDMAEIFVLRPYDLENEIQKACFTGTAHDYDEQLPWSGKERLANRIPYLDRHVHGDLDRLKKWVKRALNHALAVGDEKLFWRHIEQTAPGRSQANLAKYEFDKTRELFGHLDTDLSPPVVSPATKVKRPPRQKERRDHVAA